MTQHIETKPIPIELRDWLVRATCDLCDRETERLRAEITAHFQDACEAAQKSGYTELQAQQYALAQLGNPDKARKAFNRRYLTKRNAVHLGLEHDPALASESRFFLTISILTLCLISYSVYLDLRLTEFLLFAAGIALSLILMRPATLMLYRRKRFRTGLATNLIGIFLLFTAIAFLFTVSPDRAVIAGTGNIIGIAFCVFIFIFMLYFSIRMYFQIKHYFN